MFDSGFPPAPAGRNAPARFAFGPFVLDLQDRWLVRDGSPVEVPPKVFDALVLLLEHTGHLVGKEAFHTALWPRAVVEDSNLNKCIWQLRKLLGDSSEPHRYIETVPKRGYRFIAPVTAGAERPAQAFRRTLPWMIGAAALIMLGLAAWLVLDPGRRDSHDPGPALPVLAVLPFADFSPGRDQEYFADGMTEELLHLLARSPDLKVIARTSSFAFKGQRPDIATVASKLKVSHVLEGSVRTDGARVRVTAQLIDAATSQHLWSESFERELDSIFAIQDEIAGAVASALAARLPPETEGAAGRAADPRVHTLFLQGKFFFNRRAAGDLERAKSLFLQALDIDPEFARAWAALAGVYFIQVWDEAIPEDEGFGLMGQAAKRAVELDPTLAEAQHRLANYYDMGLGDRQQAQVHRDLVEQYGAGDPFGMLPALSRTMREGRHEEALALSEQWLELDPLSLVGLNDHAMSQIRVGRLTDARATALKALELRPADPQNAGYRGNISLLILIGVLEGQADGLLPLLDGWPEDLHRDFLLALILDAQGKSGEAGEVIARLIAGNTFEHTIRLAEIYAQRGDADAAFEWLELALQRTERRTVQQRRWHVYYTAQPFHSIPLMKLHADPRWQPWLDELRASTLPPDD